MARLRLNAAGAALGALALWALPAGGRRAGVLVNPELLPDPRNGVGANVSPPEFTDDSIVTDPQCAYALELVHLQDVSASYEEDMAHLQRLMPSALTAIAARNPHSKFAFASFVDKPAAPDSPYRRDYCFDVGTTLKNAVNVTVDFIPEVRAGGGHDFQEAQLEALARAAVSREIGWSGAGASAADGSKVVKVLVLATDSLPHREGDFARQVARYVSKTRKAVPAPGKNTVLRDRHGHWYRTAAHSPVNTDGADANCGVEEYPAVADVGRALREQNVFVVFLVAPAIFDAPCPYGKSKCVWRALREMARAKEDQRFLDPEDGMMLAYSDLLEELGVPGYVAVINNQMTDYADAMNEVLEVLDTQACSSAKLRFGQITATQAPAAATAAAPAADAAALRLRSADADAADSADSADDKVAARLRAIDGAAEKAAVKPALRNGEATAAVAESTANGPGMSTQAVPVVSTAVGPGVSTEGAPVVTTAVGPGVSTAAVPAESTAVGPGASTEGADAAALRLRDDKALRLREEKALRLREKEAEEKPLRLREGKAEEKALRLRDEKALRLRDEKALRLREEKALRLRSGGAETAEGSTEAPDFSSVKPEAAAAEALQLREAGEAGGSTAAPDAAELRLREAEARLRLRDGPEEKKLREGDEKKLRDGKALRDEKDEKKLRDENDEKKLRDEKDEKKLRNEKDEKKLRNEKDEKKLRDEKDEKKLRNEKDEKKLRNEKDEKKLRDEKGEKKLRDEKDEKKLRNEKDEKKLRDEKGEKKLRDEKDEKKLRDEKDEKKLRDEKALRDEMALREDGDHWTKPVSTVAGENAELRLREAEEKRLRDEEHAKALRDAKALRADDEHWTKPESTAAGEAAELRLREAEVPDAAESALRLRNGEAAKPALRLRSAEGTLASVSVSPALRSFREDGATASVDDRLQLLAAAQKTVTGDRSVAAPKPALRDAVDDGFRAPCARSDCGGSGGGGCREDCACEPAACANPCDEAPDNCCGCCGCHGRLRRRRVRVSVKVDVGGNGAVTAVDGVEHPQVRMLSDAGGDDATLSLVPHVKLRTAPLNDPTLAETKDKYGQSAFFPRRLFRASNDE